MQKYLIPKTLSEFVRSNLFNPYKIAVIMEMLVEYMDGKYKEELYGTSYVNLFAPIRAEIDAANKKKKREKVLK